MNYWLMESMRFWDYSDLNIVMSIMFIEGYFGKLEAQSCELG